MLRKPQISTPKSDQIVQHIGQNLPWNNPIFEKGTHCLRNYAPANFDGPISGTPTEGTAQATRTQENPQQKERKEEQQKPQHAKHKVWQSHRRAVIPGTFNVITVPVCYRAIRTTLPLCPHIP